MTTELLPLDKYLEFFTKQITLKFRNYYFPPAYNLDDLLQEAALAVIAKYPVVEAKIAAGEPVNPVAFFTLVVYGAIKNFYVRNGFSVSIKCWSIFSRQQDEIKRDLTGRIDYEYYENLMSPSGIQSQNATVCQDLMMDLEDFCSRHDPLGIMQLKLQGHALCDIAHIVGISKRRVELRNERLCNELKKVLID